MITLRHENVFGAAIILTLSFYRSTMTDVIKQDFEQLRVPWSTATKLCTLLAKCCMGFTESQEFSNVFLPLVVDSFMELANNIQGDIRFFFSF